MAWTPWSHKAQSAHRCHVLDHGQHLLMCLPAIRPLVQAEPTLVPLQGHNRRLDMTLPSHHHPLLPGVG